MEAIDTERDALKLALIKELIQTRITQLNIRPDAIDALARIVAPDVRLVAGKLQGWAGESLAQLIQDRRDLGEVGGIRFAFKESNGGKGKDAMRGYTREQLTKMSPIRRLSVINGEPSPLLNKHAAVGK